jgi:hypothetical protein
MIHAQEWTALKGLRSTGSLPRRGVLALTVEDPRLSFPPPRPIVVSTPPVPFHLIVNPVPFREFTQCSRRLPCRGQPARLCRRFGTRRTENNSGHPNLSIGSLSGERFAFVVLRLAPE